MRGSATDAFGGSFTDINLTSCRLELDGKIIVPTIMLGRILTII